MTTIWNDQPTPLSILFASSGLGAGRLCSDVMCTKRHTQVCADCDMVYCSDRCATNEDDHSLHCRFCPAERKDRDKPSLADDPDSFLVKAVIESGESPKRCFLYTVGLHSSDHPEILVMDVPIFLAEPVFRTLCLLGNKFVDEEAPEVGNTVVSQGLLFQIMQTSAKQRQRHMALHCRMCDPGLKALLLLKPLVGISISESSVRDGDGNRTNIERTVDETSWGSYLHWKELRGCLSPDIEHEDDASRREQEEEDEVEYHDELHNGSDNDSDDGMYYCSDGGYGSGHEGGDY